MTVDTRTWPEPQQETSKPDRPSEIVLTFKYLLVPGSCALLILAAFIFSMFQLRGGMEGLEEVVLEKEVQLVARAIEDQMEIDGTKSVPEDGEVGLDARYLIVGDRFTFLRMEPERELEYYTVPGNHFRLCLRGRADRWAYYDSMTDFVSTGSDRRTCP